MPADPRHESPNRLTILPIRRAVDPQQMLFLTSRLPLQKYHMHQSRDSHRRRRHRQHGSCRHHCRNRVDRVPHISIRACHDKVRLFVRIDPHPPGTPHLLPADPGRCKTHKHCNRRNPGKDERDLQGCSQPASRCNGQERRRDPEAHARKPDDPQQAAQGLRREEIGGRAGLPAHFGGHPEHS